MSRKKKLLEKLLGGNADRNFPFEDLVAVLSHQGWALRDGGGSSHRIFLHPSYPALPLVNIQPDKDGKAKSYQVCQVRNLIKTINEEKK